MIRSLALAVSIAVLPALALPADAGCMRVGGKTTMPTKTLAAYVAKSALKNSIAKRGLRPAGPVVVHCKADAVVFTTCTARRRACG